MLELALFDLCLVKAQQQILFQVAKALTKFQLMRTIKKGRLQIGLFLGSTSIVLSYLFNIITITNIPPINQRQLLLTPLGFV